MNLSEDFYFMCFQIISLKLNIMDYFRIETKKRTLNCVDYSFLEFYPTNLLLLSRENSMNLHVRNVVLLNLNGLFNTIFIDPAN